MEFDERSNRVIGGAIEVHRKRGPGLMESTCEQCLTHELKLINFSVPKLKNGIKRFVLQPFVLFGAPAPPTKTNELKRVHHANWTSSM